MAYYSNSGTQIHSGAAGYGLLQSYQDGSLGVMATLVDGSQQAPVNPFTRSIYSSYNARNKKMWVITFRVDNRKSDSQRKLSEGIRAAGGSLLEYKVGTFGTDYGKMYYPQNIFVRHKTFNGVTITVVGSEAPKALRGVDGGPLMSYQDGVLGAMNGSLQSYRDGSLGDMGPMMAFQDGSLGHPLTLETSSGRQTLEDPVIIRHGAGEYFNATGEYFSGMSGCSSCGVGQASAPTLPVLNLSDPQVMTELKTAMLIAPWMLVNLQSAADQVEVDVRDPNWTPFTTQVAEGWMQGYGPWMVATMSGSAQGATAEEYTAAAQNGFVPPEQIPNVLGVQAIFSVLEVIFLGEDGQGKNALMTPEQFPNLVAFVGAVRANGGQGEVAFARKGLFANVSPVQLGLGALVVGSLVYLAFGKKRRK